MHALSPPVAAVFDLNHPARFVHWGFIQLSLPNLIVIATMIVVFAIAVLVPFPRGRR